MLRAKARTAAIAGADDERTFDLSVRHVAALGEFVGDVIEAYRDEIREHDFGNRLQTGHRGAHGCSEDGLLGDRRVAHAHGSKLLEQPDGGLEHAAGLGDVLAEKHYVGIARHFLGDAADDGVAIGQFRHAKPPSA